MMELNARYESNTRNTRANRCLILSIAYHRCIGVPCQVRWTQSAHMKAVPVAWYDPRRFAIAPPRITLIGGDGSLFTLSRQGSSDGFYSEKRALRGVHMPQPRRVFNWPLACVEKSSRKVANIISYPFISVSSLSTSSFDIIAGIVIYCMR
jgi:hypothetical protein